MLQTWHDKGEKVLVFSNSLRILDAIKDLLSFKSTFNAGVVYLDGTVSTDKRESSRRRSLSESADCA